MSIQLFREYIEVCHDGNQAKAALALDVSRSTVNKILAGTRGITPDLAEKIEKDSGGRYSRVPLIWPDESE